MHFSWLLTKTSSKFSPKRQITAKKQNFLWHQVILVEVPQWSLLVSKHAHGWTLVLKPYPLWFCCVSNSYTHEWFCSRSMLQGTLGGRVFSCAVSSFGQASSTQENTSGTQGSSRGTFREQSFSVCTNDFMGTLHPREQNFHPAKCSTVFKQVKCLGASSRGKLSELENSPSCVLTRAKWAWSMLLEQNPLCLKGWTVKRARPS